MTERQINVRVIIHRQGQTLCQQLKPDFRGVERKFWCIPGGGLEENESLRDGLIREMVEETGITPIVGDLLFVHQFYDGRLENLEFFFNIENPDDFLNIDLSNTSHGQLEIKETKFIDLKTADILPKFLQTIDIDSYLTKSKPVFIFSYLK